MRHVRPTHLPQGISSRGIPGERIPFESRGALPASRVRIPFQDAFLRACT